MVPATCVPCQLDARSLVLVFDHLDKLWGQFVQPDAWSNLAYLLYWLLLIVVRHKKNKPQRRRSAERGRANQISLLMSE